MARKGIILAGGSGTRLHPLTLTLSKQLMPVYDKPMIFYPLATLMLANIREILVVTTPRDLEAFRALLGDGGQLGLRLSYAIQPEPRGIAQALTLAPDFVSDSPVALILGDNLFYGHGLPELLARASQDPAGARIFAYNVSNPSDYGVVAFDADKRVRSIEEKPAQPQSNYAVTGLYFYDSDAVALARSLTPSARGEYEITDLNRLYLDAGKLSVEIMGRGYAWLDTGTPGALLDAALYVRLMEERQGLKICCPEEIAWRSGFIDDAAFEALADRYAASSYGQYLRAQLRTGR